MLSHAEGCEQVGTKRVKGSRIDSPSQRQFQSGYGGGLGGPRPARGVGDADGMETVEDWRCVEDCPVRLLDEQSGQLTSGAGENFVNKTGAGYQGHAYGVHSRPAGTQNVVYGDTGGASRFFYSAKAAREDRAGSRHPTVKPTDLCKWLVILVTPPGGTVLDPFMGSGPIVWAARELGFRAVGIDREAEYVQDTIRRLRQGVLPLGGGA